MKKKNIVRIFQIIIIWSLVIQVVPALQAQPTVEITPTKPEVQSEVTFEVDLSGENVQNAKLWIQECDGNTGACFTDDENLSMTETSDGIYEVTTTLKHEDATYFQYTVYADTGSETLTFFKQTKVNLAQSSNTNGNSNNNEDSGSETPGFELVALFISVIFILLIMYRRRR